jgi:hypothetical protein
MKMQGRLLIAVAFVALLAPAFLAHAQTDDERYTIMRPEPWLPPKYQSPRGTKQHVTVPRLQQAAPPPRAETPPPIYVPETGRLLPNLPALPGAGPGGAETGQDRALRCAHQAGVYGEQAGNREAYVGGCINQ